MDKIEIHAGDADLSQLKAQAVESLRKCFEGIDDRGDVAMVATINVGAEVRTRVNFLVNTHDADRQMFSLTANAVAYIFLVGMQTIGECTTKKFPAGTDMELHILRKHIAEAVNLTIEENIKESPELATFFKGTRNVREDFLIKSQDLQPSSVDHLMDLANSLSLFAASGPIYTVSNPKGRTGKTIAKEAAGLRKMLRDMAALLANQAFTLKSLLEQDALEERRNDEDDDYP